MSIEDLAPVDVPGTWQERAVSALVAGGAAALLGVSAWLTPAAAGHSTHTQLGLSPCTFLTVTGWPCPMCGATTTFALLADGRLLDGLVNHPFATLLFLLTCAVAGIGSAEAVWPTDRWRRLADALRPHELRVVVVMLAAMGVAWIYKIALFALGG